MTEAVTFAGTKLLVKISDGATPTPAFSHPCLINAARGIQWSSASNQRRIPDCTNPELMAWTKLYKISLTGKISGSGVLNTPDHALFWDWYNSDDAKDVQVEFAGVTLANGGGYWSGQWKCTDYNIQGDVGDETQADISLESHGAQEWNDAAA